MTKPIISVENLSKAYRIGLKEEMPDTFVAAMTGWLKAPLRNWRRLRRLNTFGESVVSGQWSVAEEEGPRTTDHGPRTNSNGPRTTDLGHKGNPQSDILWALRDVSFEVNEGEVVGIIGRNGAGKSTLLKILSRITEPTHGRAVIRGRVGSLLEVGTGFHPELTGRENIYMNGTILGMKKREIDRKFDQIVDFSGVEKFLDTPIKRYSSGMQVRLAFAVAAHLEPEILIIDEVLAVGDLAFQTKCLGKMRDVAKGGRTVLFVSHNMAAVEALCHRGVELGRGRLVIDGTTFDVIAHYRRHAILNSSEVSDSAFLAARYFKHATLLDECGSQTTYLPLGGEFRLRICIQTNDTIHTPQIGIGIDSITGQRMLSIHTPLSRQAVRQIVATTEVLCTIPRFPLAPGDYTMKLVLTHNRHELEAVDGVAPFTVVDGNAFGEGRGFHRGVCVAASEWQQLNREIPYE